MSTDISNMRKAINRSTARFSEMWEKAELRYNLPELDTKVGAILAQGGEGLLATLPKEQAGRIRANWKGAINANSQTTPTSTIPTAENTAA